MLPQTKMALLSSSLFFFLFLLLPLICLSAQPYTNISLGTIFTPLGSPASWPSPNGDFAFGFRRLDSDPTRFLLAVWFDKIPNKTVVWTANGGKPVTNDSAAQLTSDGQLSLQDPAGNEVWNGSVKNATSASMLDSGNLVLSRSGFGTIWQTFDHPTDTILPGQVLKQNATVFAKLTDDDYSRGRFMLTLQDDGNLVLRPVAYPTVFGYIPYWSTETSNSGDNVLVFNQSTGSLYLAFPNSTDINVCTGRVSTEDYYVRATLDPDGVFRQYSHPKSQNLTIDSGWAVQNATASYICNKTFEAGSGPCGFNSYCVPNGVERSTCLCPEHYSLIDPNREYIGCRPNFTEQICEPGGEESFNFTILIDADWPSSDDIEVYSPMSETECSTNCLNDCFCTAAIYTAWSNGTCWKKKYPLSNGRMLSHSNRKAFIKYSTANKPSGSNERKKVWKTWVIVVSSLLGGLIVLNLIVAVAYCFVCRRNQQRPSPKYGSIAVPALCSFTYEELEEATKGFSEELGKGAFGRVYKGVLPSEPPTLIAVKKLEESILEEAEKDFANEVATIGQTHHKNLVRLLGCCKDGTRRLMVFEFMSNGSLNKFLFGKDRPEWNRRVQIALGIARGLAYLHEECRTQIIHCDIKPQNILLDDNLEAMISDFGLAKLLRLDQTRTSTGIRGTIGYFAPEWFKNVAITAKVDVYSFGVLLLEMICCRRNFDWGLESQSKVTVIDRAKECYRIGRLDLLVGEDEEAKEDRKTLERFVMVGITCIQDEPWLRPSMKKVVQMLEGATDVSIPPNIYSIRSST